MSRFSDREGVTQVRKIMQTQSLDDVTRNQLWNKFYQNYFHDARLKTFSSFSTNTTDFFLWLWQYHLKRTLDELESFSWGGAFSFLKKNIYSS